MKMTLVAAIAALVMGTVVTTVTPADARPSRPSEDLNSVASEQSSTPKNFWEEGESKPARSSCRARVERDTSSDEAEQPRRRRARNTESNDYSAPRESVAGVGPRPGAWCGWYMRTQLGGGPDLNLAWNWSRWGSRASGPQVGAVVVWPHHVGMITGQASNGQWIVKSGNDSGRVRERARSVSGAVFRVG
jgi:hypothetical protein